jgi:hypothetical protein
MMYRRMILPRIAVAAVLGIALAALSAGCGVAYQAGTMYRAHSMKDSLRAGESSLAIHKRWGEPDIRHDTGADTEIWSYAERANTNDVAAAIFYSSAKEGDRGKFLDLRFVDGKLQSWVETEHTMPAKQSTGLSYSLPIGTASPVTHY